MHNRRKLLIALGASALVAPLAALAQQQKVYRIGFLSLTTPWEAQDLFRDRLRELGYVDGRNISIAYRFASGNRERLDQDARDLVNAKVDIILAVALVGSLAAQKATRTIPIVFVFTTDPVGRGFAASLAQPGGNMTGQTNFNEDLNPKRLELLKGAVPNLAQLGVLMHATDPNHALFLKNLAVPANKLGIQLHPVVVQEATEEMTNAFATMVRKHVQGFIAFPTQLFFIQRQRIGELALKHRLPGIMDAVQYAEAGLLVTYGVNFAAQYRRAAEYVDKILKGAKPGDLPIEQPRELDLAVNLRTARAIGVSVPQSLTVRANKVIE